MYAGIYENTYNDRYVSQTVAADGTASGYIGPVPEGVCWYVERLSCWSNTAATNGTLEIYAVATQLPPSDTSKSGRQDLAAGAIVANGISDERSPIYVGPGQFLVAVWSGLTSGDLVRVSAQIRVHRLVATAHNGQHPDSWWGTEALDPKIGTPVVVGDQVDEVGETPVKV